MKVTALIPDSLVEEVKELSHGGNTTTALIIALTEWISIKKLQALNHTIKKCPLKFNENFNAIRIRNLNRRK